MHRDWTGASAVALAVAALLAPPAAATGGDGDKGHKEQAHAQRWDDNGKHKGQDANEPAKHHDQDFDSDRDSDSDSDRGKPAAAPPPAAQPAPAAKQQRSASKQAKRDAKQARKAAKRARKQQRKAEPAPAAARPVAAKERPKTTGKATKAKPKTSNAGGQDKTTICHATGSAKNPYVTITTANPAVVHAHERHHDDGDIVPAPAGGCPQAAPSVGADDVATNAAAVTGTGTTTPAPPAPAGGSASSASPAAPGLAPAAAPTAARRSAESTVGVGSSTIVSGGPPTDEVGVLGEAATIDDRDDGAVLGATADTAPRATTELASADSADDGGSLPFTGLQAGLLALIGAGALLAGVALRRAHRLTH
jgi:hypothetical protein